MQRLFLLFYVVLSACTNTPDSNVSKNYDSDARQTRRLRSYAEQISTSSKI